MLLKTVCLKILKDFPAPSIIYFFEEIGKDIIKSPYLLTTLITLMYLGVSDLFNQVKNKLINFSFQSVGIIKIQRKYIGKTVQELSDFSYRYINKVS